jgi:hypothetical protein
LLQPASSMDALQQALIDLPEAGPSTVTPAALEVAAVPRRKTRKVTSRRR